MMRREEKGRKRQKGQGRRTAPSVRAIADRPGTIGDLPPWQPCLVRWEQRETVEGVFAAGRVRCELRRRGLTLTVVEPSDVTIAPVLLEPSRQEKKSDSSRKESKGSGTGKQLFAYPAIFAIPGAAVTALDAFLQGLYQRQRQLARRLAVAEVGQAGQRHTLGRSAYGQAVPRLALEVSLLVSRRWLWLAYSLTLCRGGQVCRQEHHRLPIMPWGWAAQRAAPGAALSSLARSAGSAP